MLIILTTIFTSLKETLLRKVTHENVVNDIIKHALRNNNNCNKYDDI